MHEFTPGQDVIASTEIAQAMGMHPWEIANDPEKASKFNEIAEYMGPFEDKSFLIQKLTRGMMKEQAIDHVWKYVSLRKDHAQTKIKFEALEKELSRYER
jgi:hypothetical protein